MAGRFRALMYSAYTSVMYSIVWQGQHWFDTASTTLHMPDIYIAFGTAASLPLALASLVEAKGTQLEGARILMYSYGSGLAAGIFSLRARSTAGLFGLQQLQAKVCWAAQCAVLHDAWLCSHAS